MGASYKKWMDREEAWSRKINEKQKKTLAIYIVCTPVISVAALFALGLLAGGGMELAVSNMKYGAMFGAGVDLLMLLIMLPTMPGKRYKKQLLKTIAKELPSEAEQEEFAAQMTGEYGPGTVECISWKSKMTGEEKVWVTKDYIMRSTGTGNVQLILLKKAGGIELDAHTYTHTAGSSNLKVRYNTTEYPIIFRPHSDGSKPAGWKAKLLDSDPRLVFDNREIRDKVVLAIQRLTEPEI